MERKRWTPNAEITDDLLKSREKRKWQVALRRYVLEKNVSPSYAFYFGLSIEQFRNWIEIQFTEGLSWENFGAAWQFEHIVPVAYFDFSVEEDLLLCWNFINIRVERIDKHNNSDNRIDILAAKQYFKNLFDRTNYFLCSTMINKISGIEAAGVVNEPEIEEFIINNRLQLEISPSLSKDEFISLNTGMTLDDILLEREIIKKFA